MSNITRIIAKIVCVGSIIWVITTRMHNIFYEKTLYSHNSILSTNYVLKKRPAAVTELVAKLPPASMIEA